MKITIKCDGLSVRTKDLGMGLSVLNRIASHGIMNHSFISHSLLEKAGEIIKLAHNRLTALGTLKKDQAPVKEAINEEIKEVKELTKEEFTKRISDRKKASLINAWTIDEDKIVCDMLDKTPGKVSHNRELKKRHTANAIKTRFSILRNSRFDKLGSDRSKLIKAYLLGEKVSTSVADINRPVPTPIVDKIEKKVAGGKRGINWTNEENEIVKNNRHLKPSEIASMLVGRSVSSVELKMFRMRKNNWSTSKYVNPNVWTQEEDDAIRLNMNLSGKKLTELPWLKKRTASAISVRKGKIKNEKNES